MRRDLFGHLQKLSFSYYDKAKVGTIMSRLTSDLFDITEFTHHFPEEVFIAAIKITGSFIILSRINIPLTLIIFALLPLMFISIKFFRGGMKRTFKERRRQVGELNADIEDTLLGIRVVKSFANEDIENKKFAEGNKKFYNIKKESYKYMARFQCCTRFFDGVMYVAIIIAGSLFLINGKIDATDLVTFLLYIQTLIASIRSIVQFTEQFQNGITGIERFYEIMNVPADITNLPEATDITEVKGDISFDNVTFAYNKEDGEVLSHINLDIKSGQNIAIVGPSGGGKTTLCNLIPRFYDIQSGRITIDGKDIREITLESLGDNIGVVQQDVYMFCGTVYDNINYGKPGASMEEIVAAAKLAGAHEFIENLPDGYHTYIGERGIRLSGGQKQRLSIARLFLKNPPILILDEATSALDNESELIVQKSLEKLAKGRTTLTIAHRLTTIKNATKIIVLTENGISETGTHKELLEKGGEYAKLYSLYTSIS
jgi:ATP-binding cassette subfamily B protein